MISILVPVFNVDKYIERCLNSLLSQTYKDYEIILVNDGSTDNSGAIASSYASKYKNIHLFEYENAGISVTRNRLMDHANGDFYMFVDSDDWLEPQALEVMMNIMIQRDCDIVCCGYTMDYWFGPFYRKLEKREVLSRMECLHSLAENKGINNYPWGKLFKKECFSGVRFPNNVRGFEDTYTIFKTFINSKRVGNTTKRFYHYIKHPNSLTSRMDLETVYNMRKSYEYQENYLHRLFPEEKFSYDIHLCNNDLMILYTIFFFYSRQDRPSFIPAVINWKNVNPFIRFLYELIKGICSLRYGWSKQVSEEERNRWL